MDHLKTHLRVVAALMIREMAARFGRKPGGYIWAILEPVSYIVLMTNLASLISRMPALGSSYPLFYATGYLGFQFYRSVEIYVQSAVKSNKSLLTYPNVSPIDPVIARFLLQMGTLVTVSALVLTVIVLELRDSVDISTSYLVEAAGWGGILALGVGLTNNVMFSRFPLYEKIFGIFSRPLLLLSGVLYIPDGMPKPYQDILMWNPVCHITMLFRKGFYPEYRGENIDLAYLSSFSLILLFTGLLLFTFSRAYLRSKD
jgi:capsular polysaccharide transport system permease protein